MRSTIFVLWFGVFWFILFSTNKIFISETAKPKPKLKKMTIFLDDQNGVWCGRIFYFSSHFLSNDHHQCMDEEITLQFGSTKSIFFLSKIDLFVAIWQTLVDVGNFFCYLSTKNQCTIDDNDDISFFLFSSVVG